MGCWGTRGRTRLGTACDLAKQGSLCTQVLLKCKFLRIYIRLPQY